MNSKPTLLVLILGMMVLSIGVFATDADATGLVWRAVNKAGSVLNDIGSPSSSFSFNSQRLTSLGAPTASTDAARADKLGIIGSIPTTACGNNEILKYNSGTSSWTCSSTGISSINSDTTAAQTIQGTTNQITVNTSSGTTTIDVGSDIIQKDQANTYNAGSKQTVQASGTTAGFAFAGVTADPSSLSSGDLWYRSDLGKLYYRDGTTSRPLVAEALTQTLTGKSMSGASNTFTNIPKSAIPSSTVYNDQANTYTAGTKQTVSASGTTAGFAFAGVSSNPSSLSSGDVWYRSDAGRLYFQDAQPLGSWPVVLLQHILN